MNPILAKAPHVARILLGLTFVVFGLNGFLQFMPTPEPTPEGGAFLGALAATGYMFPLIKVTEIAAGVMLLSGRLVPLGLVLLAPILVNILAYHFALASEGTGMILFLTALEVYIAWAYRDSFRGVLAVRAQPATPDDSAAPSIEAAVTTR